MRARLAARGAIAFLASPQRQQGFLRPLLALRASGTVAELDGVPAFFDRYLRLGRLLRIIGRFDVVLPRPRPAFFGRETAAVPPALLGGLAAARMILAG